MHTLVVKWRQKLLHCCSKNNAVYNQLNVIVAEIFTLLGSESECEKERQRIFDSFPVIDGEKQPLDGAFIPQCNKDGKYKQVQCHGSTGYCWCVHDNGKKRKETEVRFKQPNCTTGRLYEVVKSSTNKVLSLSRAE